MTQNNQLRKFSALILISAFALLFAGCEKKEKDNTNELLLVGLATAVNMPGDCRIAAGSRTLNTFTTEFTGTTGTITRTGSIPFTTHQTAALKLAGRTAGSSVRISGGKAFLIAYRADSCPVTADQAVTASTTPSVTFTNATSSDSQFRNSYEITTDPATITFPTAGNYYVLIYAIPERGQSALLTFGTP
ncbi:MAG: hypothetical protein MUF77_08560 [Leptospira sp.]|jgi:hypothetical protein|nr:hypothetical protein [Leptospira sp.]